jgi:hypothetical protein
VRATVAMLEGATVYARIGDWPGWVAAAVVGAAFWLSAISRRLSERVKKSIWPPATRLSGSFALPKTQR